MNSIQTVENILCQANIANLNMNITLLVSEITQFRSKFNVCSDLLLVNLINLKENIEEFVDAKLPKVKSKNNTHFDIDFNKHTIKRMNKCNACQMFFAANLQDIRSHICDPKHKIALQRNNMQPPNNPAQHATRNMNNQDFSLNGGNKNVQNVKLNGAKKPIKTINARSRRKKQKPQDIIIKDLKKFLKGDCVSFLNDAAREANLIKDIDLYEKLEADLLKLVKDTYSDCRVHFFGSRICGLGSPTSDIDMFLDIGNALSQNVLIKEKTVLRRLQCVRDKLLKSEDWINLLTIERTRVPLIRGYNKKYKVECDITFTSGGGTYNTILLQYLLELQPLFQKMCLFMKKWCDVLQLPKDRLSSYSVVLLVLFYLQRIYVMPTIQHLQANLPNPFKIGPWTCNFVRKTLQDLRIPLADHDNRQVHYHLKELFAFYKQFDFKNTIICPFAGRIFTKVDFNVTTAVHMPTYHMNYKLQPDKMGLSIKPMTVQDIFELNRNVTDNVSEDLLNSLHNYFLLSEAYIRP